MVAKGRFGCGGQIWIQSEVIVHFSFSLCFPNLIIKFDISPNLTHVKKLIKIFVSLFLYY